MAAGNNPVAWRLKWCITMANGPERQRINGSNRKIRHVPNHNLAVDQNTWTILDGMKIVMQMAYQILWGLHVAMALDHGCTVICFAFISAPRLSGQASKSGSQTRILYLTHFLIFFWYHIGASCQDPHSCQPRLRTHFTAACVASIKFAVWKLGALMCTFPGVLGNAFLSTIPDAQVKQSYLNMWIAN